VDGPEGRRGRPGGPTSPRAEGGARSPPPRHGCRGAAAGCGRWPGPLPRLHYPPAGGGYLPGAGVRWVPSGPGGPVSGHSPACGPTGATRLTRSSTQSLPFIGQGLHPTIAGLRRGRANSPQRPERVARNVRLCSLHVACHPRSRPTRCRWGSPPDPCSGHSLRVHEQHAFGGAEGRASCRESGLVARGGGSRRASNTRAAWTAKSDARGL